MRMFFRITICVAVLLIAGGCGSRNVKKCTYSRVAFVSAPVSTASPDIANEILRAASTALHKELPFLTKADMLYDSEFDTAGTLPMPIVPNASRDYDGIFNLLYEHNAAQVSLEILLVDTRSGEVVWRHMLSKTSSRNFTRVFDTARGDARIRLIKFGSYTPYTINKYFYRR